MTVKRSSKSNFFLWIFLNTQNVQIVKHTNIPSKSFSAVLQLNMYQVSSISEISLMFLPRFSHYQKFLNQLPSYPARKTTKKLLILYWNIEQLL